MCTSHKTDQTSGGKLERLDQAGGAEYLLSSLTKAKWISNMYRQVRSMTYLHLPETMNITITFV